MEALCRGMQAILQHPLIQWRVGLVDESDSDYDALPSVDGDASKVVYADREDPELVYVDDGGKQCAALLLTEESAEEIKLMLQHARRHLLKLKQAEADVEHIENLRERLVHQLEGLEKAQVKAVRDGCLEEETDIREQKSRLLLDLETLDSHTIPDLSSTKIADAIYSDAYNQVLTTLNKAFEGANLLPDFWTENVLAEPIAPFDTALLESLESPPESSEDEVATESNEEEESDIDTEAAEPAEPAKDVDHDALFKGVGEEMQVIQELRNEIAQKEEDIDARQMWLDDTVITLEAAGYDCPTGKMSKHLDGVVEEFINKLKHLRAAEAHADQQLAYDGTDEEFDASMAQLEGFRARSVANAMRQYRSLRDNLTSIGVDCADTIAQRDKLELQHERLGDMMNHYQDMHRETKKIEEYKHKLANAEFERHIQSYQRAIAEAEDRYREYEAEYLDARRRLEEVGVCPPPVDKMPELQDEASFAGSIDMEDFLAANELVSDEGQNAGKKRIHSLPGLADVPKEPQMTRWRYSLGSFGDEVDRDETEDIWSGPDYDDSSSIDADDSLSVRRGFISEMSDQEKLAEWRAEEDKARIAFAHLGDEMYDGIAALFET